jgi:hypothetical protein
MYVSAAAESPMSSTRREYQLASVDRSPAAHQISSEAIASNLSVSGNARGDAPRAMAPAHVRRYGAKVARRVCSPSAIRASTGSTDKFVFDSAVAMSSVARFIICQTNSTGPWEKIPVDDAGRLGKDERMAGG